jgi:adenylate cyclase
MSALPDDELRRIRIWRRFHVAITALYGLPIFAVLSVMCTYFYVRGVDIELRALQARLTGMSTALAGTLDPKLVAGEPSEARAAPVRELLGRIATEEGDVSSIYIARRTPDPTQLEFVVDWVADGEPAEPGQLYEVAQAPKMAEAFDGPQVEDEIFVDEWGPTLSAYAPIHSNGTSIAVVGVDLAGWRVDAVRREVLLLTLAVFIAASVVLFALAQIVAWSIREPLVRIIATTQAINEGRLEARAGLDRRDEFGILGRHFDGMAAGLSEREFIRETFGRYMSERLAKRLLGDPTATQLGGEEIEVTILFADLRSYSTISERLSPSQVVTMLNEYMGEMGKVVDDHHGVVIEFLGDAILAVFGAPEDDPDHPEHAVQCALAMQQRLEALNSQWEQTGLAALWKQANVDRLRARIGVHTGNVVAGNMGGFRRMKYAVIGEAVNIAAKVEGLNNRTDTDLLVTAATRKSLPASLQSRTASKGTHDVTGQGEVIEVFAVGSA